MTSLNPTHPIFSLPNQLLDIELNSILLASSLSLSRNFDKFLFSEKVDLKTSEQIAALIYESLCSCPTIFQPVMFSINELSPLQRDFLIEHFFLDHEIFTDRNNKSIIIDNTGSFLALINFEDHLKLICLDTKQEIEQAWNRLVKIETHIGNSCYFSFSDKFGFLTANPKFSGTGLNISLHLHVPGLIHSQAIQKIFSDTLIDLNNLLSITETCGDIIVVNNSICTGFTEEYLLATVRMWLTKIIISELTARKKIIETNDNDIKNKISRSVGIISHSYQINLIEALSNLSLIILGADLKWIEENNINLIFELFNIRRAHLILHLNTEISGDEIAKARASYLKNITQKLSIVI